jgi:predicted aspartyl protease
VRTVVFAFFALDVFNLSKLRSRIIAMMTSTRCLPGCFRDLALTLLALAGYAFATAPTHAADKPAQCTYVELATLPLRYVGPNLEPAVDGTIDGTPATMLVDTGADQTYLTMNGATRRDLSLSMTGRWVEGIGGSSRLYGARLNDFSIGPVKGGRRAELAVIGSTTFTPPYDAIVGASFLLQADLELDLRAKRMTFYRPRDCRDTELLLWKEDTVVLPFARGYGDASRPLFKVVVNGRELEAMIDSGSHDSFMSLDAARRAGIDVNAPDVISAPNAGGVGTERVRQWIVPVKTLQLGGETLRNVQLTVTDTQSTRSADLYLGQDFLRAHRVLFAMSQDKLYVAYLGGEVFGRGRGVEPWMHAEAEQGNADAQYVLASMYGNGRGVPRDPAQAKDWLDKAVAQGQPNANLTRGRQQMLDGHVDTAIPQLRRALDQLPADRLGPLWLYVARVRHGEADLAKTELQATLKRQKEDDWPAPIADFYLGKINAARLLEAAGKDSKLARSRTCMAERYMAEWHEAHGNAAEASALRATVSTQCARTAAAASATGQTPPAPASPQPTGGAAPPDATP